MSANGCNFTEQFCASNYHPHKSYKLFQTRTTFLSAKDDCEEAGAELAILQEHNDLLDVGNMSSCKYLALYRQISYRYEELPGFHPVISAL